MSVKDDVLSLLIESDGFLSGEEIGKKLFCSRNAVWKAIKSLKNEGYEIEAVTNKGYMLCNDVLSAAGIEKYLEKGKNEYNIYVYKTVTSTNDLLKAEAETGGAQWRIIAANEQSMGKGRRGRSFFSPASGLYMSILLRPSLPAEKSLLITTAAAVAVAKAVYEVCGKKCGIKWVNDLFLYDLKICGILTEGSLDLETGGLQYAILGIGINVANPYNKFPEELKDIAGAIYEELPTNKDIKNRLCAAIINHFASYYDTLEDGSFLQDYKALSTVIGKKINILGGGKVIPATAVDIDNNAGLVVQLSSGEKKTLSSGEVSIRLQ